MKVLQYIINQLIDIQKAKLWIGSTYESKLKNINEQNAFVRPLPDLHSVAEIISHLTIWQKETILKIKTREGALTDSCEENWHSNEVLIKKTWTVILNEYEASFKNLIELLRTKEDDFLNEEYYDTDYKGNFPYSFVINGMLHHSIYHLGQIGIITKYLKKID